MNLEKLLENVKLGAESDNLVIADFCKFLLEDSKKEEAAPAKPKRVVNVE